MIYRYGQFHIKTTRLFNSFYIFIVEELRKGCPIVFHINHIFRNTSRGYYRIGTTEKNEQSYYNFNNPYWRIVRSDFIHHFEFVTFMISFCIILIFIFFSR